MGYGSLFATVITLFLVPLCYIAVEDIKRGLGRSWNWYLGRKNIHAEESVRLSAAVPAQSLHSEP